MDRDERNAARAAQRQEAEHGSTTCGWDKWDEWQSLCPGTWDAYQCSTPCNTPLGRRLAAIWQGSPATAADGQAALEWLRERFGPRDDDPIGTDDFGSYHADNYH